MNIINFAHCVLSVIAAAAATTTTTITTTTITTTSTTTTTTSRTVLVEVVFIDYTLGSCCGLNLPGMKFVRTQEHLL